MDININQVEEFLRNAPLNRPLNDPVWANFAHTTNTGLSASTASLHLRISNSHAERKVLSEVVGFLNTQPLDANLTANINDCAERCPWLHDLWAKYSSANNVDIDQMKKSLQSRVVDLDKSLQTNEARLVQNEVCCSILLVLTLCSLTYETFCAYKDPHIATSVASVCVLKNNVVQVATNDTLSDQEKKSYFNDVFTELSEIRSRLRGAQERLVNARNSSLFGVVCSISSFFAFSHPLPKTIAVVCGVGFAVNSAFAQSQISNIEKTLEIIKSIDTSGAAARAEAAAKKRTLERRGRMEKIESAFKKNNKFD